jgi:hypothetical protein
VVGWQIAFAAGSAEQVPQLAPAARTQLPVLH